MRIDDEALAVAFAQSHIAQALLDEDGRFLIANQAMRALLQVDETDLMALHLEDITDPLDQGLQRVKLEELQLSIIDSFQTRRRYVRDDGSMVHAQTCITAIRGSTGEVRWLLLQIADLTDESLMSETFRLLASHGSDALMRTDSDGILLWISPTAFTLTGWRPEQLVGVPLLGLVHPDGRPTASAVHSGASVGRYRARFLAADGSFQALTVQVDPLPGHHGSLVGRVATMRADS